MNSLDLYTIKSFFSQRFFHEGQQCYYEQRVHGLSYNRLKGTWFAEVEDTFYYYVEINIDHFSKGEFDLYCDCPAFNTHHSCKHVIAVLLKISEEQNKVAQQTNKQMSKQFIDQIIALKDTNRPASLEKIPMQITYYIHYKDDRFTLSLRTGVNHLYVVRNLRDLVEHVLEDETYFFTKRFSYDPMEHYFLEQDRDIFLLLKELIHVGDFYTDRLYYKDLSFEQREIPIAPHYFPALLQRLVERHHIFETNFGQYENCHIEIDNIPSHFTVQALEGDEISLKVEEGKTTLFSPSYRCLFSEGTFYFPRDDQMSIYTHIKRKYVTNEPIVIPLEQRNVFFSEVLPVLDQASPVTIERQVEERIKQYPLQAKMYVQMKENVITAHLQYHYGSYVFDPFKGLEQTKNIVVRDMERENTIMSLIEQAHFRYNGKDLYLPPQKDELLYKFLYDILPLLEEEVELFITDNVREFMMDEDVKPNIHIGMGDQTNLLEINFDLPKVDPEEMADILAAVIEKKKFYRLQNGALLSLEQESFHTVHKLFDHLDLRSEEVRDGTVMLPAYKGLQVDEIIETDKNYEQSFKTLLHHLQSPAEQVYEIPTQLQATLRPYQIKGYRWFKSLSEYHLGGILADDMGLGKTLQTLTYFLSEKSELPHLVVVPSSVTYNWLKECERFAPSLRPVVIDGNRTDRRLLIEKSRNADVWITSYGMLREDIDFYKGLHFHTFILDEAQNVKNPATKTYRAVRKINAQKRFALSGTPIENSLRELWAIFQIVLPNFFPPLRDFERLPKENIAQYIKPFILRRLKEDVLEELPNKIETVHGSELTEEQKTLYVSYLHNLQQEATNTFATDTFHEKRMDILSGLTRLRQLCCHPSLFIENYTGRSGKLDELMTLIHSYRENGKRMLIFSQFTSMHELIIEQLNKASIDYFYLHGQTPAQERVQMAEAFNEGEKDIFLISLRAGGTGLNLTGADTVILFDLWWNPAVEDQAAGRAHRFGQRKVVHVIRLIAKGTIEERIYELQQKKRELFDQVIQPGETMLQSLTEEDIRLLLNL